MKPKSRKHSYKSRRKRKIRSLTRSQYMNSKNFPNSKPLKTPEPDNLEYEHTIYPINMQQLDFQDTDQS